MLKPTFSNFSKPDSASAKDLWSPLLFYGCYNISIIFVPFLFYMELIGMIFFLLVCNNLSPRIFNYSEYKICIWLCLFGTYMIGTKFLVLYFICIYINFLDLNVSYGTAQLIILDLCISFVIFCYCTDVW